MKEVIANIVSNVNHKDHSWRTERFRITEFDPDIMTAIIRNDWRYNRVQCKNCTHASGILPGKTRINCNREEGEQYPDTYIECGKYNAKPSVKKGDFIPFIKKHIFDTKSIKQFPLFPISYYPRANKENICCKDCRYHKTIKSPGEQTIICSCSGWEYCADTIRNCRLFEAQNNNPWRGRKPNSRSKRQEEKQPVLTQLLLPLASE